MKLIVLIIGIAAAVAAASGQIHITAVATPVKNSPVPESPVVVKDGYVVSVRVINTSSETIMLPSRRLGPHVITKDSRVEFLFTLFPNVTHTRSGGIR